MCIFQEPIRLNLVLTQSQSMWWTIERIRLGERGPDLFTIVVNLSQVVLLVNTQLLLLWDFFANLMLYDIPPLHWILVTFIAPTIHSEEPYREDFPFIFSDHLITLHQIHDVFCLLIWVFILIIGLKTHIHLTPFHLDSRSHLKRRHI